TVRRSRAFPIAQRLDNARLQFRKYLSPDALDADTTTRSPPLDPGFAAGLLLTQLQQPPLVVNVGDLVHSAVLGVVQVVSINAQHAGNTPVEELAPGRRLIHAAHLLVDNKNYLPVH